MNGKEDNEEAGFKVNDRRKFNPDGSLREGYEPAPEKPKQHEATAITDADTDIYESSAKLIEPDKAAPSGEELESVVPHGEAEAYETDDDFPGADNPASFVNFLSTLATNAAAALGAMPHPATGQRSLDLETGRYWIDVLAMLQEKTKGNLHPKEEELFKGLVSDLRMQYVQISRMAEERLKQQAAQKFSANDILGKK